MTKYYKSAIYKHQTRFECNYCKNYEVTSKKALILHIKYSHNIEKVTKGPTTYMCNTCKKEFEKNIDLKNHIKKTHM